MYITVIWLFFSKYLRTQKIRIRANFVNGPGPRGARGFRFVGGVSKRMIAARTNLRVALESGEARIGEVSLLSNDKGSMIAYRYVIIYHNLCKLNFLYRPN